MSLTSFPLQFPPPSSDLGDQGRPGEERGADDHALVIVVFLLHIFTIYLCYNKIHYQTSLTSLYWQMYRKYYYLHFAK